MSLSLLAEEGWDLRRERERSSMAGTVIRGRVERRSKARREAEGEKCKDRVEKTKGVYTIDKRAKDKNGFSQPVLRRGQGPSERK